MERYKVIKEFGLAKKGDLFDRIEMEDEVIFVMERDEQTEDKGVNTSTYVGMTLGEEDMQNRIDNGFITVINDDIDENDVDTEEDADDINWKKIAIDALTEVQSMIFTYENDHKQVIEDYEVGNVQPCVKVEADTVYFNMIKVLKEIEKTLSPNK